MRRDTHLTHYLVLASGLGLLGVFFVLFRFNELLQIFVGIAGCIFYIFWGIFHHSLEDRVTGLVVFEYVSFGLLAFLLMLIFVTI